MTIELVYAAGGYEPASPNGNVAAYRRLGGGARVRRVVDVTDYGAVDDSDGTSGDGTDNSPAAQDALDEALSDPAIEGVYFPHTSTGRYRLGSGLTVRNTTGSHAPMPHLVGPGSLSVQLVADFNDGAVLNVDGATHTLSRFFMGGGITGLQIAQAPDRTGVEALRHNGWWYAKFVDLLVEGTGRGIYQPDLSAVDDKYGDTLSSYLWAIEQSRFRNIAGWAIDSDSGMAFGSLALRNVDFAANGTAADEDEGGAIRYSAVRLMWEGGACHANGSGVQFVNLNSQPSSNRIAHVEFDGNRHYHVDAKHLNSSKITLNRMISRTDSRWGGVHTPPVHVKIGDAGSVPPMVSNIEVTHNHHRATPDNGDPVVLYDFQGSTHGLYSTFRNSSVQSSSTSGLVEYRGHEDHEAGASAPTIVDSAGTVLSEPS